MLKKKFYKTREDCEVTFEVEAESAGRVDLLTEANDWKPVTMKQRKKDGVFYAKLRLPKEGQYQFRYLIDGQTWVNDARADAYVSNGFGGENSIVDTVPSKN